MTPGIRRILKISVIAVLIVALAFLTVAWVTNREPAPYRRTSDISKAECMLCNDEHFPDFYMPPRNNMAIVYLNSFQTEVIDINPHPVTQQDKWILESYNGSCRIHFSKSPHGTKLLVSVIQDRGTASCSIEEDAQLDIEAVSTFLCSDCISSMLDKLGHEGNNSEVAFVNLITREIIIAEQDMRKQVGDFLLIGSTMRDKPCINIMYLPLRENYVPIWNEDYTDFYYPD